MGTRTTGTSDGAHRVSLGTWPTPLEPAPRLARHLGMDADALWLKRDDLTGLGAGGNKVRKLEYLCAEALRRGATTLLTSGRAQSNHARITAAAARRLGLDCVLVLAGAIPGVPTGNLALEALMDTRMVWVEEADDNELDARVKAEAERLRSAGAVVEVIPLGGSNALGALGYAECGRELETDLPELRHVVVAVGTGGTMAGLVSVLGADRVLGVDVGATADPTERVTGMLMGLGGSGSPSEDLRLRRDQVGAGYGILTPGAATAILDVARLEGVFLDPVYTAKAMSGLAASVRDGSIGPDEPTVFVHTGGLPGLFGHDLMHDPGHLLGDPGREGRD